MTSAFASHLPPPTPPRSQIIFRKVADLKHEQELDEMQQNQPQPEFSQDHIVRRLISKFRKPSDAGAIGAIGQSAGSNLLQVPQAQHGPQVPTISGQVAAAQDGATDQSEPGAPGAGGGGVVARSLAGKQSRWSQLVASAAAGAASSKAAAGHSAVAAGPGGQHHQQPVSSTRSLLDISHPDGQQAGESSSNRSSADGRDDEVDENYFRPGGKGHQALLDNMDKR